MLKLFFLVFIPLLSLVLFTLGSGFLTTLLTIHIHAEKGGPEIIGYITAVYYLGLVLGSFRIGRYIRKVGHIRVYAAFASILAIVIMLQGLILNNTAWLVFRFVTGFATAGIYIAIESWILAIVPEKKRGAVLSLYMIAFYGALALGQFLLNIGDFMSLIPFCIIVMLCSLSIIPVSMTRSVNPKFEDINALSLPKLYKISPSGMVACFGAGMITSGVYGFLPLFVKQLNFPNFYVSFVMSFTIIGAMVLQYPIGRISEILERRTLLAILSFLSLLLALALMIFTSFHLLFLILVFIFGGFSFVIYPVGINLTCDDMVSATQGSFRMV